MRQKQIGYLGENIAAHFLHSKGYEILGNNFAKRGGATLSSVGADIGGEIDLIAKKNGFYVFVEVKTRSGNQYGSGEDSINFWKKKHLLSASLDYLRENSICGCDFRIDLIEINLKENGEVASIRHLEDIMNEYA